MALIYLFKRRFVMKRKISNYDHNFEVVVSQMEPSNGKHSAVMHYGGLPPLIAIEDCFDE